MKNPFTIGVIQEDEGLCNRTREKSELIQYAKNLSKVLLCSPRRFGKSSLMQIMLKNLQKEGFLTAYVDLFPISSEHDFISRFASSIYKGIGKEVNPKSLLENLTGVFSRITPTVDVGAEGYSISAKFDRAEKTDILLDDLMENLKAYIQKRKVPACIVLDEFQEITELSESKKIEGILRSHIQTQGDISYFFVGSRRRILQDMFSNKSRPFYKSAFFYSLGEIAQDEFVSYILGQFDRTGKTCEQKAAIKIYSLTRGYPYYVQKLSSISWDQSDTICTEDIIDESFLKLVQMEAIDFEGAWSGLLLSQKSVLKSIADNPTSSPFSKEYMLKTEISSSGFQKALNALLQKDLVEKRSDGVYRLTDPIMEVWLKR